MVNVHVSDWGHHRKGWIYARLFCLCFFGLEYDLNSKTPVISSTNGDWLPKVVLSSTLKSPGDTESPNWGKQSTSWRAGLHHLTYSSFSKSEYGKSSKSLLKMNPCTRAMVEFGIINTMFMHTPEICGSHAQQDAVTRFLTQELILKRCIKLHCNPHVTAAYEVQNWYNFNFPGLSYMLCLHAIRRNLIILPVLFDDFTVHCGEI